MKGVPLTFTSPKAEDEKIKKQDCKERLIQVKLDLKTLNQLPIQYYNTQLISQ